MSLFDKILEKLGLHNEGIRYYWHGDSRAVLIPPRRLLIRLPKWIPHRYPARQAARRSSIGRQKTRILKRSV